MIFLIKYKLYTSKKYVYKSVNYEVGEFNFYVNALKLYYRSWFGRRDTMTIYETYKKHLKVKLEYEFIKPRQQVDVYKLFIKKKYHLECIFPHKDDEGIISIIENVYLINNLNNNLNYNKDNLNYNKDNLNYNKDDLLCITNIIKKVSRNQLRKIIGALRKQVNPERDLKYYYRHRIYIKGKFQIDLMI